MKLILEVDINRQPEDVFPWIAEPDKAMRWQKDVKGGEILKETPGKVGTTFKEEMGENGNSLVMFGEITNYIPNELIAFHLESKLHRVDVSYSVVWNGDRSTVFMKSTIHWKFPMNIINLFVGRRLKRRISRQTEFELLELKRLCEMCGEI